MEEQINKKLDTIIDLVKKIIVIESYRSGASMDDICRNIRMSKTLVVKMLKGIKRINKE